MKWSLKAGRLAGIDVRVHATFFLLLAWVAAAHGMRGRTLEGTLASVGFTLAIFGCIVLHELGHALAARHFGIPTRDITLLPIGGVARLERMPRKPSQELWIALAGPAVNVAIAAALAAWIALHHTWMPLGSLGVPAGPFLERLLIANVSLVLFNLIPAFPMDGGRVLRALLAARLEFVRATRIAVRVGQGMAVVLALAGLFGNGMLLFIAMFVWIGAEQELYAARMRAAATYRPLTTPVIIDLRLRKALQNHQF